MKLAVDLPAREGEKEDNDDRLLLDAIHELTTPLADAKKDNINMDMVLYLAEPLWDWRLHKPSPLSL